MRKVITPKTTLIVPHGAISDLSNRLISVKPGETHAFGELTVRTVPAYNTKPDRLRYHPRENDWIGYIFEFGGKRIYHAGDTDFIPEMKGLSVDVALLPMGGTYTMDADECVLAANALAAKVVVPMHYKALLKDKAWQAEETIAAGSRAKVELLNEVK